MSDEGNPIMAFLIGVILGAFLGAVLALLYAPEAGEELRQKIQSGVETNWQKASQELDRMKHAKEQPNKKTLTPITEG